MYTGKEVYQLLLRGDEAIGVIDDWLTSGNATDLRVRRAKTRGCVVIETSDAMFANRVHLYHPDCKVAIR